MPKYSGLERVREQRAQLSAEYESAKAQGLNLNMTRGVPSSEQLMLSEPMLSMPCTSFKSESGADCRNYGILEGIPEARRLMAQLMELAPEQVFVGGASSLNLMHDCLSFAVLHGTSRSEKPWGKLEGGFKFLCPCPGYDRHFAVTESLGAQLIPVKMTADGPDMDEVERLISDPAVKGIWCVPKYSNPQGIVYSDEVVKRLAAMKPAAPDFIIMWDNAYGVHDLYPAKAKKLLNLMDELTVNQNEHMALFFASMSKITFAGAGIAAIGAARENFGWLVKHKSLQTICYDKINQLRHAKFLPDISSVRVHMEKHAALLRPKFEIMGDALAALKEEGLADFSIPVGGYFISLDVTFASAKRVVGLLADIGVAMTAAGATYPYGTDPDDKNIRIAPTFPSTDEIARAAKMICLCVRLASLEALSE